MVDLATIIAGIVGAVLGGAATSLVTFILDRAQRQARKALAEDLERTKKEHERLVTAFAKLRDWLQRSEIIRDHYQPVLLLGPRNVGKTSLLKSWHAPWEAWATKRPGTFLPTSELVPVRDIEQTTRETHPADSELIVTTSHHIGLRVYDFPGDPAHRPEVIKVFTSESVALNARLAAEHREALGAVLLFMMDCEDPQGTNEHYAEELFNQILHLVQSRHAKLEKIIVVFNKIDKLRESLGAHDANSVRNECQRLFKQTISRIQDISHPGTVVFTYTVLGAADGSTSWREGETEVLAAAAEGIIRVYSGPARPSTPEPPLSARTRPPPQPQISG